MDLVGSGRLQWWYLDVMGPRGDTVEGVACT